jgi:hypothetical protein
MPYAPGLLNMSAPGRTISLKNQAQRGQFFPRVHLGYCSAPGQKNSSSAPACSPGFGL